MYYSPYITSVKFMDVVKSIMTISGVTGTSVATLARTLHRDIGTACGTARDGGTARRDVISREHSSIVPRRISRAAR